MQNIQEHIESGANVATKIMYSGAGASVVSGITLNQIGVIFGMLVGLVGCAINWYYRAQGHKLKVETAKKLLEQNRGHEALLEEDEK
jgi:hypothetical protein